MHEEHEENRGTSASDPTVHGGWRSPSYDMDDQHDHRDDDRDGIRLRRCAGSPDREVVDEEAGGKRNPDLPQAPQPRTRPLSDLFGVDEAGKRHPVHE